MSSKKQLFTPNNSDLSASSQMTSHFTGFSEKEVSRSNSLPIVDDFSSDKDIGYQSGGSNSSRLPQLNESLKAAEISDVISLSVDSVDDSMASELDKVKNSKVNAFDSAPPTILVVDDHTASRMTAAALLALEGYEVVESDSGAAALDQVMRKKPDLILLDVMMPEMNGFEVCQQLKQNEQTRLIPVIFITSLSDRRSRILGIEAGGDDFLTKPFDRLELSARVKSLVRQKRLNEDLDHAEQVLFSIARAIESRDPNTGNHCERLMTVAKTFGEFLGLSSSQIRDLEWGGYLHDIGKVGIPDSVLLKTGKLTSQEWEIMRQHVLIGEDICQPLRTMRGVIPIIRHHHERWDGSGYPDGLVGDKIPYLAQVFQVIDIYDALTSERPYKRAFTQEEALGIMAQETHKGWRNPELIQHFTQFICTTSSR